MQNLNNDASPMEIDIFDDTTPNNKHTIPPELHLSLSTSPVAFEHQTGDEIDVKISFNGNESRIQIPYGQTEPVGFSHHTTNSVETTNLNVTTGVTYATYSRYPIRHRKNSWVKSKQRKSYFVRCQSRTEAQREHMSEADIELAQLKNLSANNENESEYWYHATSWKKAKRIMRMGPRISKGPSDLANRGAFYLNPSHDDCYSWFATKDSSFKGRHAMLIYKFDPEILSSNGKRLDDKGKWKNLVTERSKCSSPCKEDWIYTYQNSNPSSVNKSGNNVKARSMQNGEPAMQLIICQERMCRNIHKCLVGCVFYKKLN